MSLESNWRAFALAIIKTNAKDDGFLKSEWCEFLKNLADINNIDELFRTPGKRKISYLFKGIYTKQIVDYLNNNGCYCFKGKDFKWSVNSEDFDKAKKLIEDFKRLNFPKDPKFKFFRSNSFQTYTGYQRKDFRKIAEILNIPILNVGKAIAIDYKYKKQFLDYFLNFYKK